MEITRLEKVTKIYCDVCSKEITHSSRKYIGGNVVCRNNTTIIRPKTSVWGPLSLDCEDIVILLQKRPELTVIPRCQTGEQQ